MAEPRRIPLLEWVSAGIGVAITLAMFGLLTLEGIRERADIPPLMEAKATGVYASGGAYIVEVLVRNSARKTGAGVQLEGTLKDGEKEVETSSATLSYVPGESQRRAGIVFRRDPRKYGLEVNVKGYERP